VTKPTPTPPGRSYLPYATAPFSVFRWPQRRDGVKTLFDDLLTCPPDEQREERVLSAECCEIDCGCLQDVPDKIGLTLHDLTGGRIQDRAGAVHFKSWRRPYGFYTQLYPTRYTINWGNLSDLHLCLKRRIRYIRRDGRNIVAPMCAWSGVIKRPGLNIGTAVLHERFVNSQDMITFPDDSAVEGAHYDTSGPVLTNWAHETDWYDCEYDEFRFDLNYISAYVEKQRPWADDNSWAWYRITVYAYGLCGNPQNMADGRVILFNGWVQNAVGSGKCIESYNIPNNLVTPDFTPPPTATPTPTLPPTTPTEPPPWEGEDFFTVSASNNPNTNVFGDYYNIGRFAEVGDYDGQTDCYLHEDGNYLLWLADVNGTYYAIISEINDLGDADADRYYKSLTEHELKPGEDWDGEYSGWGNWTGTVNAVYTDSLPTATPTEVPPTDPPTPTPIDDSDDDLWIRNRHMSTLFGICIGPITGSQHPYKAGMMIPYRRLASHLSAQTYVNYRLWEYARANGGYASVWDSHGDAPPPCHYLYTADGGYDGPTPTPKPHNCNWPACCEEVETPPTTTPSPTIYPSPTPPPTSTPGTGTPEPPTGTPPPWPTLPPTPTETPTPTPVEPCSHCQEDNKPTPKYIYATLSGTIAHGECCHPRGERYDQISGGYSEKTYVLQQGASIDEAERPPELENYDGTCEWVGVFTDTSFVWRTYREKDNGVCSNLMRIEEDTKFILRAVRDQSTVRVFLIRIYDWSTFDSDGNEENSGTDATHTMWGSSWRDHEEPEISKCMEFVGYWGFTWSQEACGIDDPAVTMSEQE